MSLTANCDIFASVSEMAFNTLASNVARQRPSLFNYGTESFVADPSLMCRPIETANGLPPNQPLVALQAPLPVPGTGGAYALEYCAQLSKLELDFHPSNKFQLPKQISPLPEQALALHAQLCAGIACPSKDILNRLGYREAQRYWPIDPVAALRGSGDRPVEMPQRDVYVLPPGREQISCFCLELFLTARFRCETGPGGPAIGIELRGLEIVDITPDGLERSLECLLTTTLMLGVLPRLRIAVQDMVFSLGDYGNLTIGLTPISAAVPFNPSISSDRFSVFVDVALN